MSLVNAIPIPTSKIDLIVRNVEISSYMPGRIRLYSQKLVNNPALAKEITGELTSFSEIDEVNTNTVTGSVLIKYEPARLRRNNELLKAESYIMSHAKHSTVK